MSQIAELSEAEIEERFYIVSRSTIQLTLARLASEREGFTVRFGDHQHDFLTILLGVQVEKERFYFDCSGSPETNHRLAEAREVTFVGRPGGIHVQFTAQLPSQVFFSGAQAFAARLPERMLRLQRRDAFRVAIPLARPLTFHARLPNGRLLTLAAHDLSLSGIGLTVTAASADLAAGVALTACHMALPDDPREMFIDHAVIRHVTSLDSGFSLTPHWRVGIHFVDLSRQDENRLQRYIARVEHERHELS